MNNIIYTISGFFGYFLVMIIFMIVAILLAKSKAAWIPYSIGGVLQLLSITGNYRKLYLFGLSSTMLYSFIIYVIIMVLTAFIIVKRYNEEQKMKNIEDTIRNNRRTNYTSNLTNNSKKWYCTHCGTPNNDISSFCKNCGKQRL